MGEIHRSVGAYNILLSVNPLIKDDLRLATTTSKELLAGYKSEYGTTIFSSEDAGFIEMRHDFKFKGGKRGSRGPSISLKVFDVGLGFLTDLYFDFTQRALEGIRDAESAEAMDLKVYFEKLRLAEAGVKDVEAEISRLLTDEMSSKARSWYAVKKVSDRVAYGDSRSSGWRRQLAPFMGWTDSERERLMDEMAPLREADEDLLMALQVKNSIMSDLQAKVAQKTLPKVYIMYGVGDNLSHWAGPIESYLGEIKHKNDGRSETTEFVFATDVATEQFQDAKVFNLEKKEGRIKFFNRVQVPVMAYDIGDPGPRFGQRSIGFDGHPHSFHDCIVKLISNYLFHLGIKNNLIVLPNLDTVLGPLIENCYLSVIYGDYALAWLSEMTRQLHPEFAAEGGIDNPLAGAPRAPWRDLTGVQREKSILSFVGHLFAHQVDPHKLGPAGLGGRAVPMDPAIEDGLMISLLSFFKPIGKSWSPAMKTFIATGVTGDWTFWNSIGRQILLRVFNAIGLSDVKSEGKNSMKDGAILATLLDSLDDELDLSGAKVKMINPFSPTTSTGRVESWVMGTIEATTIVKLGFKAAEDQEEPLKDWLAPLKALIDAINECAASDIILLQEGYETDVGSSQILREEFGGGTYLGYVYRKTFAVPLDDTPTYVFGDRELIKLLLYGEFFKRAEMEAAYKGMDYLSEKGDFMTGVIWNPAEAGGRAGWGKTDDVFWKKIGPQIGAEIHNTWGIYRPGGSKSMAPVHDFTYLRRIYNYHHPLGPGLSLGYYNGFLTNAEDMKKVLPDEFGYTLDDDTVATLFEQDYPLFLANTDGANILSYAFDVNKFLYGSLFGSVQEVYYNVAKRYLAAPGATPLISSTTLSTDEREAKIKEIMDKLKERTAFTGTPGGLTTKGSSVDMNLVAEHLAQILHLEHDIGTTVVVRKNRASSTMAFLMLFLEIFERQYIGTVKTLPFFELSNLNAINKTVLAIIKSTRRVGASEFNQLTGRQPLHPIADYLSGWYRILGFQHVITGSDTYSEFSLVKDIIADFNNES